MTDTLNLTCPSCGKESPPDLPNCVHCGTRLTTPGQPRGASLGTDWTDRRSRQHLTGKILALGCAIMVLIPVLFGTTIVLVGSGNGGWALLVGVVALVATGYLMRRMVGERAPIAVRLAVTLFVIGLVLMAGILGIGVLLTQS